MKGEEMQSLRKAAQQALEALEVANSWGTWHRGSEAITALRAALAEDATPRSTDEDNQKLLVPLENLSRAAYWVVEGGEFWEWVKDKSMPYAAAKELDELAEMMEAADQVTYGMSITLGDKRIDPASIYKQEVPKDHIPDANKMVDVQQEMDCYGDGNVYRGQRSSDSKTPTFTCNGMPAVEGPLSKAHRISQESRQVEPVAWIGCLEGGIEYGTYHKAALKLPDGVRFDLYSAPPKRKPLTEKEIKTIYDALPKKYTLAMFARALERAHGIGGEE